MGKNFNTVIKWKKKLAAHYQVNRRFTFLKTFDSRGLSAPTLGLYTCMYMTIIFKYLFPNDLVTRHGPSGIQGLQIVYKRNPGLTLTYLTVRPNLVKIAHCALDQ